MSEMNKEVEEPQEQPSDRAPMPDEELQKILEAHRKWVELEGEEGKRADLREAIFQKADLREANLSRANLEGAKLQKANLFGANLQEADLHKANLQGANLGEANLQGADLSWANLQGAYLGGAWGLTPFQVKDAQNWDLAFYSDDFLKKLGLPPDHNERVKKKLAEEKKATGAKP